MTKTKFWTDEKGIQIPYNRVTKQERFKERKAKSTLKKALAINNTLAKFKQDLRLTCQEVFDQYQDSIGAKKNKKGNFVWYNFDRSIRIDCNVNERIEFDDLGINACKSKLDEFLSQEISAQSSIVKQLVLDAFSSQKGRLDTRKVMSLLAYKSKIDHPLFQEAMELLQDSIRRPSSRTYFRVWIKDENGKYQNIDLNFSSI